MKKEKKFKDEKLNISKGAPRKFFSPVMRKMRTKTVLSQAEDNN